MSLHRILIFALLIILAAHGGAGAAVLNSNTDYSGSGDWVGTAGPDTMTNNSGVTINGSILAEDGNDQVIMETGPDKVAGVIDGGAGIDEIVYGGGAWTYGHASIVNFENFSVNATADLILNGVWDLANGTAQVSGGNLTINDSLTASGLTISSGSATINGSAVISGAVINQGTLGVSSGGTLNAGSLDNSGTASIAGTAVITGLVNNSGGLDVTGSLTAGSVINSANLGVTGSLTTGSLINSGGLGVGGSLTADSLNNDGGGLGVGGSLIVGSLINSGGLGVGGYVTAGSLINSGAVGVGTYLSADSLVNSGNIGVGGSLIVGSLINSGNIGVGSFLSADSLNNSGDIAVGGSVTAGSLINSGFLAVGGSLSADSLYNSGTLDANGSLSAGSLTNSGYLDITTGGTLEAGTLINSGSLEVNGYLISDSLTNSGYLGGSGTINADVINRGVLSPGNSIGTLVVVGSVVFEPGSTLVVELGSTGISDLLYVSGPVTINGGTISAVIPVALYPNGFSWTIIQADGGVTGLFDSIDYKLNSVVLSLVQVNSGDALKLVINRESYGSFASGGAADTGRGLDGLVALASDDMENLLLAMDFGMSADQIAGVVNALNPEMYTAFSAASLNAGNLFDRAMARRMRELGQRKAFSLAGDCHETGLTQLAAAFESPPLGAAADQAPQGGVMWGRALGLWADQGQADGYLDRGQTTGGAAVGADYTGNKWLVLGLAVGATRTDLSWSHGNYSGDMDAVHTGLYARADFGGFFSIATASYSHFASNSTRPISFEDFNADAKADFDADLYAAGLALGYQLRVGDWLLEPVAGLDYQHLREDGFSESGASFLNLDIAGRVTDSALSNLGLSASRLIRFDSWKVLSRLGLSWRRRLGNDRPSLDAAFVGYGSAPFSVSGAEFASDLVLAEAGLSVSMRPGLDFFADYSLAFADDYQALTLTAGLVYSF